MPAVLRVPNDVVTYVELGDVAKPAPTSFESARGFRVPRVLQRLGERRGPLPRRVRLRPREVQRVRHEGSRRQDRPVVAGGLAERPYHRARRRDRVGANGVDERALPASPRRGQADAQVVEPGRSMAPRRAQQFPALVGS